MAAPIDAHTFKICPRIFRLALATIDHSEDEDGRTYVVSSLLVKYSNNMEWRLPREWKEGQGTNQGNSFACDGKSIATKGTLRVKNIDQ